MDRTFQHNADPSSRGALVSDAVDARISMLDDRAFTEFSCKLPEPIE